MVHTDHLNDYLLMSTTNAFVDYLNQFNTEGASHEKVFDEYSTSSSHLLTIATKTEEFLRMNFKSPEPATIILTGFAGTGKTRLCRVAYEVLTGQSGNVADWSDEEPVRREDGFEVVIVKDLSQLPDDAAADLMRQVEGLKGAEHRAYLIAANEGKLRNALKDSPLWETVDRQLRGVSDAETRIRVVNLGRTTSSSYVLPLLERMTAETHWSGCASCPASGACILRHNRDQLAKPEIQSRVKLLYEVIEHQDIRVTLRDTLIHLSHMVTGGLSCASVTEKSNHAAPDFHTYVYYQNCWGDRGRHVDAPHLSAVTTHLARLPVGEYSLFAVDQFIIYGDLELGAAAGETAEHTPLFQDAIDLAGNRFENERRHYLLQGGEGDTADRFLREWLSHCRRKVFFEWQNTAATDRLLPFHSLLHYQVLLKAPGGPHSKEIRLRVIRALNSVFTGLFLDEAQKLYIPSGYRDEYLQPDPLIIDMRGEWELKFEVTMPSDADLDCDLPQLHLRDKKSAESVDLDLVTFEYLMRVGSGGSLQVLAAECILKLRGFQNRLLGHALKIQGEGAPIRFLAHKDRHYQAIEIDPDLFSPQ
jgi:hypothetical protein